MTDQAKLQKLFEAALKDPSVPKRGLPQRAYPTPNTAESDERQDEPAATAAPARTANTAVKINEPAVAVTSAPAAPAAPVLDDAASTELAALLDEKLSRQTRKRRREAWVTAIVFFGVTGGGMAWFVQSPARIDALTSAIREIRSASDIKSIVAKYQAALDKISVHSKQIDQATSLMGVKASAEDDKDPNLDAEMKQMMGGEGKTVGERNAAFRKAFDNKPK